MDNVHPLHQPKYCTTRHTSGFIFLIPVLSIIFLVFDAYLLFFIVLIFGIFMLTTKPRQHYHDPYNSSRGSPNASTFINNSTIRPNYCKICGHKVDFESNYCSNCGSALY